MTFSLANLSPNQQHNNNNDNNNRNSSNDLIRWLPKCNRCGLNLMRAPLYGKELVLLRIIISPAESRLSNSAWPSKNNKDWSSVKIIM